MTDSEQTLQRQILDVLNMSPKIGFSLRVNAGRRGTINLAPTGTPDIIGYRKGGQFFAIEVKLPGNKPTPAQVEFLERAVSYGATAFIASSLEDVQWLL